MFISPTEDQHPEEMLLNMEKPKKQPWWEKKGFIVAAIFSAIWLAFIWDYLFSSGWWGTRHELSPAEFIGGFCGLFLPILLSFLLSSYFDRAAQLGFEAQTLRSYLNELVYPTDSGSAYTQALTSALREQVKEFKQAFSEVGTQTQEMKNQMHLWSEDMNRVVKQLDIRTAASVREIAESINKLTQAAVDANEKSAQISADLSDQTLSLNRTAMVSAEKIGSLLFSFQTQADSMKNVASSFENTNEQTKQALDQAVVVSNQMRSQIQAIESVIYEYESGAKQQGEFLTANLAQAESVLKIQNEALEKAEAVLKTHNNALIQAETAIKTHNQAFAQAELVAKTHQDSLEKAVENATQKVRQMEDQFDGNVRKIILTAQETAAQLDTLNFSISDEALNKLNTVSASLTAVVQKVADMPQTLTVVHETAEQAPQAPTTLEPDCIVLSGSIRKNTVDMLKDATAILDRLQTFSVDMAHIFTPKAEDSLWKKYYEGDRAVFMRHITRMISETQHKQIVELYQSNTDFHQAVSRYMTEFEEITKITREGDDNKLLMSILIGSDIGRLYMVLADVLKKNVA